MTLKVYRALCTSKKRQAQEAKDNALIQEAESTCYKFLQVDSKTKFVANDIPLPDWEQNFNKILNEQILNTTDSLDLKSLLANYPRPEQLRYFMTEEVKIALRGMKNNKAPGPDRLINETLKMLCDPLCSLK